MADVIQSDISHVEPIAEHMREADKLEIWLSHRRTPYDSLIAGLNESELCLTIFDDDELPVGMFGVGRPTILGSTGTPWMLATDGLLRIRREFLRQGPHYVSELQRGFSRLINYVHAENKVSIRWLRRLGFTIMPKVQAGPFNAWFHPFERIADVHPGYATDRRHRYDNGRDRGQRDQSGPNS